MNRLQFKPSYFLLSLALLALLIGVALFVQDRVVRPFVGDLLAVVLVHLMLQSVLRCAVVVTAAVALGVAVTLEMAQLFDLLSWLGLEDVRLARTILGATFDPWDLVAYLLGFGVVMMVERWRERRAQAAVQER